jgi:hypothetical protein
VTVLTVAAGATVGLLALLAGLAVLATRVPALAQPARRGTWAGQAAVVVVVALDLWPLLAEDAERPDSMLTHLGYAVAALGLLPLLVSRRPPVDDPTAEVEPASLWVVAIALLAVAVCVVRLVQTR